MSPLHYCCLLNHNTDTLLGSSQRTPTVSVKSRNEKKTKKQWRRCFGKTPFLILPDIHRNENKLILMLIIMDHLLSL